MNCLTGVAQTSDFHAEEFRLQALEDLKLLDTPESESFDRITRMACELFQMPIAAVSLTDRNRQWFKSAQGVDHRQIPRDSAPCAEVTRSRSVLHVPNLLDDPQFADSFLAKSGIRFYAGAPLATREGRVLGAMCVLSDEPRKLSSQQLHSLEDLAAMVMSQIELQHEFGRIDPASGLPNRHQLEEDILDQHRRSPDASRVLLLIELADLRHVTDAVRVLGTSYLEDLIRSSAGNIKSVLEKEAVLYHVGFSSFAVLLDDAKEPWHLVIDTIAERLRIPTLASGNPVTITAAFGVFPFRLGQCNSHDAVRGATSAVQQAREQNIDYAVYSAANDATHQRRFTLLRHVRESIEAGTDLHLVYQPKLDLRTGTYVEAEALLRWSHPVLGNVPPGEFIPLVEQTTLARPLTQWVLAEALRQVRVWHDKGLPTRISVNVSARNLEEPDFADHVAQAVRSFGLDPSDLELEFTESALIRHEKRVLEQLFKLRGLGIDLAIDDFGTGYSSFSYLRKLPACCIKLDRSFVSTLTGDAKARTLVPAMISMIHDLGCHVVAEGVETADILERLREYDCDKVQGYLIARPLDVLSYETLRFVPPEMGFVSSFARSPAPTLEGRVQ